MKEAATLMPGGVSSPVRAFKSVGGGPVVFDRVKGAYAFDVDGNQYVDYVGTWGPAICGHADGFLVQAGSGVATLGLPDSPGVPPGATQGTLVAEYNNLESVEALLKEHECAAVVLEPVVGNSGFIPPTQEFLEGLRAMTTKYGALLVFDEVMTGFRIDYGCAQKHFGVTPDVTTMGKVIGGGLPVGAYGGRKDIMEQVAPAGPMYQAGTLSGNPLAMAAGIKTLEILKRPGSYEYLDKITSRLINGIIDAGKEAGHAVCGSHISGMFGL